MAFWDELPHVAFGVWPPDGESHGIAQAMEAKWACIKGTDKEVH